MPCAGRTALHNQACCRESSADQSPIVFKCCSLTCTIAFAPLPWRLVDDARTLDRVLARDFDVDGKEKVKRRCQRKDRAERDQGVRVNRDDDACCRAAVCRVILDRDDAAGAVGENAASPLWGEEGSILLKRALSRSVGCPCGGDRFLLVLALRDPRSHTLRTAHGSCLYKVQFRKKSTGSAFTAVLLRFARQGPFRSGAHCHMRSFLCAFEPRYLSTQRALKQRNRCKHDSASVGFYGVPPAVLDSSAAPAARSFYLGRKSWLSFGRGGKFELYFLERPQIRPAARASSTGWRWPGFLPLCGLLSLISHYRAFKEILGHHAHFTGGHAG